MSDDVTITVDEDKRTHSMVLIELTGDAELFHSPAGEAFATIPVYDHLETWALASSGFKRWLRKTFFDSQGRPPSNQAFVDALGVLEAKAQFEGAQIPVFLRVAEHNGSIYLDLGNEEWQAVEIDADGWRVVSDAPVKFWRSAGMLPLPVPVSGGSLEMLRPFVNCPDDPSFRLLVGCLLGALHPNMPFPVVCLQGEQDSAKTTVARGCKELVDPGALRSIPRSEHDFAIMAKNNRLLAFNNVRGIPTWFSDAICRVSHDGGLGGTRKLYTDSEESVFNDRRPVLLNGIEDIACEPDLIDRAVVICLPRIGDKRRRPESEFWPAFEEARPRILGALLDGVAAAIAYQDIVSLPSLPRLADFTRWVTAAESAFGWPEGSFLKAYAGNRHDATEAGLEADAVAQAIITMSAGRAEWQGTASALYSELCDLAGEKVTRSRDWPKSPGALSRRLRRSAPPLKQVGIEWEVVRTGSQRVHHIRRIAQNVVTSVITVMDEETPRSQIASANDDICANDDITVTTNKYRHGNISSSDAVHDDNDDNDDTLRPSSIEPQEDMATAVRGVFPAAEVVGEHKTSPSANGVDYMTTLNDTHSEIAAYWQGRAIPTPAGDLAAWIADVDERVNIAATGVVTAGEFGELCQLLQHLQTHSLGRSSHIN